MMKGLYGLIQGMEEVRVGLHQSMGQQLGEETNYMEEQGVERPLFMGPDFS